MTEMDLCAMSLESAQELVRTADVQQEAAIDLWELMLTGSSEVESPRAYINKLEQLAIRAEAISLHAKTTCTYCGEVTVGFTGHCEDRSCGEVAPHLPLDWCAECDGQGEVNEADSRWNPRAQSPPERIVPCDQCNGVGWHPRPHWEDRQRHLQGLTIDESRQS